MVYEMRVLLTVDPDYTWMQAYICSAAAVCDAYAFICNDETLSRELAYQKRPNGGEPPIRINSSGDVF